MPAFTPITGTGWLSDSVNPVQSFTLAGSRPTATAMGATYAAKVQSTSLPTPIIAPLFTPLFTPVVEITTVTIPNSESTLVTGAFGFIVIGMIVAMAAMIATGSRPRQDRRAIHAWRTQLGGIAIGSANFIANNGGNGVLVGSDPTLTNAFTLAAGSGNSIFGNLIFANSLRAIDLGPNDGPTANDVNDVDLGPNGLQNKPVLTLATSDGASTVVSGSLNSVSGATYRIEFFSGIVQDQAEDFLGANNEFIAVGGNNAPFAFVLDVSVDAGDFVTATATNLLTGDTSELSLSIAVI